MLQEFVIAAAAGGSNPSAALSQMGFEHLITEMTSSPGDFAVSWVVLITLIAMSRCLLVLDCHQHLPRHPSEERG